MSLRFCIILLTMLIYLSGVCAAANIQVYIVPAITDNKILPTSSISASYLSNNISISAAKGEYEPASFVVNSDQDISSLTIEPTNLTGTGGVIPADSVDIRTVKVWWQAGNEIIVSDPISQKQLTPELLLKDDSLVRVSGSDNYLKLSDGRELKISDPAGIQGVSNQPGTDEFPVKDSVALLPINLQKKYKKQFWVTIKVPDNAVSGQYSGKISIKAASQTLKEINFSVTVLPFNLSDSKLEYSIYYWGWPTGSPTIHNDQKSEQQYRAELKNLVAHGISNPNTWFINDQILSLRRDSGISNKNLYHAGFWISHQANNNLLKDEIRINKEKAGGFGTENYYLYGIDEEDLNNSVNRAQIQAAHEAGAKVFCAEYTDSAKESVADILDILISSGPLDYALAAKYHSYGHKIFSYGNPQAGLEKPENYRINYGLLLWQKDYDGAMDYAYQGAFNNTWNDFDFFSGVCYRDHNFVYPTVDGVIDTIQWEGFREGVDDIRYLSTLLDRVIDSKSRGVDVSGIESWISELKQSDLSTKNLGEVRQQMARYIVSLPEAVCAPNTVLVCRVCNSQGTAWTDDSSKCSGGKTCSNGQCISPQTGQMSLSCPGTCVAGQSCSCKVDNCTSGIFIVKNLESKPINLTRMIMDGDFPVTFYDSSPYLRPISVIRTGTVQAMAICLDSNTFGVQRRNMTIVD